MDWCNFGIGLCYQITGGDPAQKVGLLLSWADFISMAGIIFVASEFAESNKTRFYLFHLSNLKTWLIITVLACVGLVTFSNVLPLIPGHALPFLGYPIFYEVIALGLFSFLLVGFCMFLSKPNKFMPKFGYQPLLKLASELRLQNDPQTITKLIPLANLYLEKIIIEACKVGNQPKSGKDKLTKSEKLSYLCREILDVILSKEETCTVIAKEHSYFITNLINYLQKHNAWPNQLGNILLGNIMSKLFTDENSLMMRELKFGGYEGIYQPLSSFIFTNNYVMSYYSLMPINNYERDVSIDTLKLEADCLKKALKHYYSSKDNQSGPGNWLGHTIEKMGESTDHYTLSIDDLSDKEIWRKDTPHLNELGDFFTKIEYILQSDDRGYVPAFSDMELKVVEESVAYSIAKAIFKYLEGFSWLRNTNPEYVRHQILDLMWLLYDIGEKTEIQKAIQLKVLDFIKERIEENLNDHYPSMIRLLTSVHGYNPNGKDNSPIQNYFYSVFGSEIAPKLIEDKKFREKHLPSGWQIKKNTILDYKGRQIFPFVNKKKKVKTKSADGMKATV